VVGRDAELVRRSVPPAALCFRWDNVWLAVPDEPAEATALQEPSAELLTIRLALIDVTGRWIDPSGEMTDEMAAVVRAYQEARGLTVDGAIGRETTRALETDLGCPDRGGFTMVAPTGIGPRAFRSVADLVAATDRFARNGRSFYASLDQLLRDSQWDGRNAMFLGCDRWEAPPSGLSCSWSGATPLQLVGLVDDPATPGLGSFSILYARSTAV
jgi:Putative peptidoglycan binding domain